MSSEFFPIDQRHKVDTQRLTRFARREAWAMTPRDFAADLVRMFGRHVQAHYVRDRRDPENGAKFSVHLSMHCYDPRDRMRYTVEAVVAPDGSVQSHGGNWLFNKSSAVEEACHFAERAPQAYAKAVQ